jgi:hypothetical protein
MRTWTNSAELVALNRLMKFELIGPVNFITEGVNA